MGHLGALRAPTQGKPARHTGLIATHRPFATIAPAVLATSQQLRTVHIVTSFLSYKKRL
jgi:hypothetical protein